MVLAYMCWCGDLACPGAPEALIEGKWFNPQIKVGPPNIYKAQSNKAEKPHPNQYAKYLSYMQIFGIEWNIKIYCVME